MRRYPYLILSFSISVCLVAPFILKLKDYRLEPYPSIIFPSGANLYDNKDAVVISKVYEMYGYNDRYAKIDREKFFKPIPPRYFYPIFKGHFGIKKFYEEFKLYKPPLKFVIENSFTEESKFQTKEWLKKRLREQNLKDSVFFVRTYQIKYNLNSLKIDSKICINEEEFGLF